MDYTYDFIYKKIETRYQHLVIQMTNNYNIRFSIHKNVNLILYYCVILELSLIVFTLIHVTIFDKSIHQF